ncbi:MAG: thioredoxin domain-containing protein [Bacillota bacterium]|nr:thioredoxin domain-containing protein [Bacillota bacterium]
MSKNNKSPFKLMVIVTLLIIGIIAALVIITNQDNDNDEKSLDNTPSIEGQPVLGEEDAPVTIVEFGDFKCPACKAWGENIYPQLIKDYVDSGKVKFAYINVLFHGEESALGAAAAEAIRKQNSDEYWEFHKKLFDAQPSANHDGLWITTDKVMEVASELPGIDMEQFKTDLKSQEIIDAVTHDNDLTEEFKISQTPTIMVNDKVLADPFDYDKIQSLIESELEGDE